MVAKEDIRNYVNPHPSCSRDMQLSVLEGQGETYIEDKTGAAIKKLIGSVRSDRNSVVRVLWAFNLAPVAGSAQAKRKAIVSQIAAIHKRGGFVREMATGLESRKPADLAQMTMRASDMVGNYARGAAGKSKTGRPKKMRSPEEREIMKFEWHTRKNKTIADVILKLRGRGIKTNKNELYRLLGSRG